MIGNKYLIKQHVSECFREQQTATVCFEKRRDLPWAGNGTIRATPFPFWGPKLLGWLPLRRGGCVKVLPPSIPPTAREIPSVISSYGPKNKPSTPPTAEIFWHPLQLFGLKEEDMEKEGEGLTSTSSNSLLQEDSFSANSFHSFLFLLSLQKVEHL